MPDVGLEFEEIPPSPEERDMIKAQKEMVKEEAKEEGKKEAKEEEKHSASGRLSRLIQLGWNAVAPQKGYESVTEQDIIVLNEGLQRFEEKLNTAALSPELEAGLTVTGVLGIKLIKKKMKDKEQNKDGAKI